MHGQVHDGPRSGIKDLYFIHTIKCYSDVHISCASCGKERRIFSFHCDT
jgi:hypothetical protein